MTKLHTMAIQEAIRRIRSSKTKHRDSRIAAARRPEADAVLDSCRLAVEAESDMDAAVEWIEAILEADDEDDDD